MTVTANVPATTDSSTTPAELTRRGGGRRRRDPNALPDTVVETKFLKKGFVTAQAVLDHNSIVAFDGKPGTGKTTCARLVAAHASRNCALVRMPWRPAPLDVLRHAHMKITGFAAQGTRFELQQALLDLLADWNGCLIVDELQYTQANAMQELVYLYEESGHAFGLVIIGTGVLKAIDAYPQLKRRILSDVTFSPLRNEDLLEAVRQLDPRLARLSIGQLVAHDQAACGGLLSKWAQTVEWLDLFGITGRPTSDELALIRTKLPVRAVPAEDLDDSGIVRPGRRRSK